jgi:plastocyanin
VVKFILFKNSTFEIKIITHLKSLTIKKTVAKFILLSIFAFAINSCKKKEEPGINEVFIQNKNFYPSSLAIKSGTTITWTNHTVTSNNNLFDSGKMGKDDVFSYTFKTSGVFDYRCNYYNSVGTIIVK